MMRDNIFLSDKDISELKEKIKGELLLIGARHKESVNIGSMAKEELSDPVDEANSNIQVSHDLRMKNRESFYYKKLKKSLVKITEGNYGLCKECDAEITKERLLARLTADMCINCKEESEFAENSNFFDRRSKSLGKTLNELATR
jgi:DnaK suppressor protein